MKEYINYSKNKIANITKNNMQKIQKYTGWNELASGKWAQRMLTALAISAWVTMKSITVITKHSGFPVMYPR